MRAQLLTTISGLLLRNCQCSWNNMALLNREHTEQGPDSYFRQWFKAVILSNLLYIRPLPSVPSPEEADSAVLTHAKLPQKRAEGQQHWIPILAKLYCSIFQQSTNSGTVQKIGFKDKTLTSHFRLTEIFLHGEMSKCTVKDQVLVVKINMASQ